MTSKAKPVTYLFTNADTGAVETITLNQLKQYEFIKYEFRKNIIDFIETSKCPLPEYLITISYYQKIRKREIITSNHRFIRNQFEELFNPANRSNPNYSTNLFFIERYKTQLLSSDGNTYYGFNQIKTNNNILNTITNEIEYDLYDNEVVLGSYHSHILKGKISKEVLMKPRKKLRELLLEVTGAEYLPQDISQAMIEGITKRLLETVCRRSEIVGNSNASVKVEKQDPKRHFDGFIGWKGMIAYVTKQVWNAETMAELVDGDNSSIVFRPATIPISQLNKRMVLPESTFTKQ